MVELTDVQEPLELAWTVWPARRQPLLSVVVAAFCLAVSWWAMAYMGSPYFAFLTLVIFATALSEFYFPMHCRLSADGVERRHLGTTHMQSWSTFRLAEVLPDRLVLYRYGNVPRWYARQRAVPLRFEDNQTQILEYIRRHVPLSSDKD
ncbi:MAG: hypothetical protein ABFE07_24340 [Armatimonadia bacterium]